MKEMTSLDELEKKLIKSDNLELEELEHLISGVSQYCVLSSSGFPRIEKVGKLELSDRDKIHLVLSARYLANKLQQVMKKEQTVSASMTNVELSEALRMRIKTVNARVSDLRKDGYVSDVGKATYSVLPHSIDSLIQKLDKFVTR